MNDEQAREDFLTTHFPMVNRIMGEAEKYPREDRVAVLCDLDDQSGTTFAAFFSNHAKDEAILDNAWCGHINRRILAMLLEDSWRSCEKVIKALRSNDADVRYKVLVISSGGVQLRGVREAAV